MTKSSKRPPAGLPDKDTLLAFLRETGSAEKTDIARHFGLKGGDRRALREMIRELEAEGRLGKRGRNGFSEAGALPPVGVADVIERDGDGELYVRLVEASPDAPRAILMPDKSKAAPGLGDRVLVKFQRGAEGWEARLIKKLDVGSNRVLGVIRKSARETRVEPVDRRSKDVLLVPQAQSGDLRDGDLVLAAVEKGDQRYGPKRGKILEHIGKEDDPRAASLIAIYAHSIPTGFSEAVEREAEDQALPTLKGREDLRDVPFITIDPADARDHDDAVYAARDEDPKNPGGWIVWVAIADVAAYVRPGSQLDREARDKGNSTYFPDRVEPMLPEVLSNGLCSLKQGENRACLAVRMVFDKDGRKTGHRFVRGLMRSHAKLSYEQAQAAIDGEQDDATGPIMEAILYPLWNAYHAMLKGRLKRSPLQIESAERRIRMAPDGGIASIEKRTSLEAHRLIEEMMIQANVCAAETLEQKKTPLIYRIHDAPSQEKIFNLADFLSTIGKPWNKGEPGTTKRFNKLLDETRDGEYADVVNEVVLRTQMQAIYSPENVGHFGLNLDRYAHFTSPIRRYSDLIVHRGLIRALGLGKDGLTDREIAELPCHRRGRDHDRAPLHGRRTRRHGPLHRRLSGGAHRGDLRRKDHRRHPVWPVHPSGGHGRGRSGPRLDLGQRIFHPRRPRPRPGRRTHGQAVHSGPDGRGQTARGHARHRRTGVRNAQRARAPRSQRPGPALRHSRTGRRRPADARPEKQEWQPSRRPQAPQRLQTVRRPEGGQKGQA
ncbi:ribonuclease R [Brevundimonas sp. SORGH_AS 993]|nr:ribonuclease R [Brevundimonas sp. SORGH_AS_0993]